MRWRDIKVLLPRVCLFISVSFLFFPSLNKEPVKLIQFKPWELVTALAWSPDGSLLAVAAGSQVYLVTSSDWQTVATWPVRSFSTDLAFSPDSGLLATASRDGWLRVWQVSKLLGGKQAQSATVEPDWSVLAHRKGANSLAFSPSGDLLASGGNDSMSKIWDLKGDHALQSIIGGTFSVPRLSYSPDGKALAVVNGELIRLREVESGRITSTFRAEQPLYSLAFSPDGLLLAAGDSDNGVNIWKADQGFRTGNPRYPEPEVLAGHQGKPGSVHSLIWELQFSPDGLLLASAGGDGTVRLWDVASRRALEVLRGHPSAVTSLAFHPKGRLLASGGLDGAVRIWPVGP